MAADLQGHRSRLGRAFPAHLRSHRDPRTDPSRDRARSGYHVPISATTRTPTARTRRGLGEALTHRVTEFLHLDRLPAGVRNYLDSWRFWALILGVAVAWLALWAYVNTTEIAQAQANQARDEAVHVAQIQSNAQSAYTTCMASRPLIAKFAVHVRGVNDGFATLVENSRAIVTATPVSDPQYRVRVANLARLERAAAKVAALQSIPVPTRADCVARRAAILNG